MNKVVSFLKKALKVTLWVIICYVLLLIVIALLIQIPKIQTKITQSATSFISKKTNTRIEIKKVNISFPKSIVIKGIFLEDRKKDTLLYIQRLKINVAFRDLFNHKIHINSFTLEETKLYANRIETDSLFNYNFLLTAFSDTAGQKIEETKDKPKWTFGIDDINLKNIQLEYDDNYGGAKISAILPHLKLKMDQIDLVQSIFKIEELLIENLNATILLKSGKSEKEKQDGVLPIITANKVQISNTNFNFGDSISKLSIIAAISQLKLKKASIDLKKQLVLLNNFYLSKSVVHYKMNKPMSPTDTIIEESTKTNIKSDWKVSVKETNLDDNFLTYTNGSEPEIKNAFDVNHLNHKHVSLTATDFYYSSVKTEVSIKEFTTVDQNNFSITKFETDFYMDNHSITTKKLKIETPYSNVNADLSIQYSSIQSLKDSIQFMIVDLDIKNASIPNSHILYFVSRLRKQAFFKYDSIITTFTGKITGPLNNLNGEDLLIKTGSNTILKTNFTIAGLPFVKTAHFNFPNLELTTSKKDISIFADTLIPENIDLPEALSLQVNFNGTINTFESTVDMNSSFGSAHIFAVIDENERFYSKFNSTDFDLGSLLKNKDMFGPVSLIAEADGHGLSKKNIEAKTKAEISSIWLNKYTYHKLSIDGTVDGQEFEGKIKLDDENANFDFDGLVNLNPNEENFKFLLNLKGANLQKLNFTKDDIRIGLIAQTDLKGIAKKEINGKASISNIHIIHEGKNYSLDSVLVTTINKPDNNELHVGSSIIDIKYKGTISLIELPKALEKFMNNYFSFSDTVQVENNRDSSDFNFEIQLHNHPILSDVFLPQLKEFELGLIVGSYTSAKNELKLNATIKKISYGTTNIKNFVVDVNSDVNALIYNVSCSTISNSKLKIDNLIFDGKLSDNKIFANISSTDKNLHKKLLLRSQITKVDTNYKLTLNTEDFYLMNERWNIADDNYIEFGKNGLLIHHLNISKKGSQVNINSVNEQFNDDVNIFIKDFELSDISGIIEKDTALFKGNVEGNALFKRVNNTYGIIADAKINNLFVSEVPIGNIIVKAENPTEERFNFELNLSGTENNLTANGFLLNKVNENSMNIKVDIQSLSMKTVQAFSMGSISDASGNLTGNFLIEGKTKSPLITGQIIFDNVFITPTALNNSLHLKHETIQLKKEGIYFNSFTILDINQHKAIIDGSVQLEQYKNFNFAIHVNTRDFLLINSSAKNNEEFYGKMIVDSKIDIKGPLNLPVIDAKLKMKKGSNFTFAVQEKMLTADKGEGVIEFNGASKLNPILYSQKEKQKSNLTGFDISSIIEVEKEATIRLLLDPTTTDSLVVRGEAALSFAIDRSGKMSLTGTYSLNEGSYLVTLESLIKRKFTIQPGGYIKWNGDPLDAEVSINANYLVRTSPINLVADQMAGVSETDKNAYKRQYPFIVLLKLRGLILHPEISFEIQLPAEDKGILGGAVNAKLNMLNEDPSALNKQVFALLVLGRFVQENVLQTETNVASTVVRTTVGKLLSAQLNQFSSKLVPGVELDFDIQSYDDYETGQAEGRTQLDIGIKKQLFNERLTVQVGGTVDVEGEKAKENSVSDITSDVTVEYKLTKDGRYRLKGFRQNKYEGAIEGQLVETGVGVLYVRDFNYWRELFKNVKSNSDSLKGEKQ